MSYTFIYLLFVKAESGFSTMKEIIVVRLARRYIDDDDDDDGEVRQ